jgi:hypothetical protein
MSFPARIILLFFTCILSVSFSEGSPACIIYSGPGNLVTDHFGNAYVISGESIRKYNNNCVFQREYSNKTFGAITSADATNPLRIVLFYRDFNRVIFLDDMMSQLGEPVQLETIGFPTATLACASHDNGLWIFDQQSLGLIRLNRNLVIEQHTGNLAQLLDTTIQPNFLIEKDTRLYLNNPATGILVFDIFGTYSKTIPVRGLRSLQIIDDNLVYYNEQRLMMWNLLTNEESLVHAADTGSTDMRIEKEKVYVMGKTSVSTFTR